MDSLKLRHYQPANLESTPRLIPCGMIDTFQIRILGNAGIKKSRKEVIHPQVPLRMPCYDFFPVTDPTLGP